MPSIVTGMEEILLHITGGSENDTSTLENHLTVYYKIDQQLHSWVCIQRNKPMFTKRLAQECSEHI